MIATGAQNTSQKMRVVFIATGEIALPTLQSLLSSTEDKLVGVVTQPDKPAGRAQKLTAPAIKIALLQTAVPILQPERIKSGKAIEQIRAWEPEVIVVMAYGQIVPRAILDLPRLACLNLHASLLPRHRGAAPIQAAIVAGDRETGITVIYMDEALDTGDILLQSRIEILPNETGGSLHDRLAELAPSAMTEALKLLGAATAPRIPQDSAKATYAPKLKREDGKIDWSEPAELIERKIRAFNPWPGGFMLITEKSGKRAKLKIFRATIADAKGKPGEIIEAGERGLVIATSDRALLLEEVQIEGKRRMSAGEFMRGQRWIGRSADDVK
jgi:methionyl-tRNA formyltransferase